MARHLADEQDHRHGVLFGQMHGNRGVGGAGAAADEGDAGRVGQFGVGHRHKARAAFVAANDGLDVVALMQRVEHGEIAFAGYAEHPVSAVGDKAIDQQVRGATGCRSGHGEGLGWQG
jgi:hypothetical protein